jgi:hypothetical protein
VITIASPERDPPRGGFEAIESYSAAAIPVPCPATLSPA